MAFVYVLATLFITLSNISQVDDAHYVIFSEAFSPRAGIVGSVSGVRIQGFRKAAFSNKAGVGTASIAHAAVETKLLASEGLVGLLEPFIDYMYYDSDCYSNVQSRRNLYCGDVMNNEVLIIATGERIGGVNLTSMAFDAALPGFLYVLAIAEILFAFSIMLSWSYYGLQSWKFLFGRGKTSDLIYILIFLIFTVLGAAVTKDAVIKFSDAMILALVFPNMIALFFLFPKVKEEIEKYQRVILNRRKTN